jgi:hypothetical protein
LLGLLAIRQFCLIASFLFSTWVAAQSSKTDGSRKQNEPTWKQVSKLEEKRKKQKLRRDYANAHRKTKKKILSGAQVARARVRSEAASSVVADAYTAGITPPGLPSDSSTSDSHQTVESDKDGVTSTLQDQTFERLSR